MSMPYHFVLVRHGESEANVVRDADLKGDASLHTAEFINRPDHAHRLTKAGVEQAKITGQWIKRHILDAYDLSQFARSYCSPSTRTIETAAYLDLPLENGWRLDYLVRERDFGDGGTMSRAEFTQNYPHSAKKRQSDPLFWRPPGGESIIEMTESRVREMFHTLHREAANTSAIVVSHAVFLTAVRLGLEVPTPQDWAEWMLDSTRKVDNCQVLHYSRIDPFNGTISPYVQWVRSVCPWKAGLDEPGEWRQFSRHRFTNAELLAYAEATERMSDV